VGVGIVNFSFGPASVTINVGDSIKWTVLEGTHTVSLTPGGVFSRTFDQAGSYPYFCTIHPSTMKGTVTVNG
jgi:plastocyanin